ncbi:MAG: M20/M25/M40 family metallo-hydrolase, partial [Bacteroidetes bacterium]|nr:M20/M25/M40 family metallo-hydrolase [Bacteroidota bacterium]
LTDLKAFELLSELTTTIGPRLSGSEGYEKAVIWGRDALKRAGADSVWLEPVMIPKWVRGPVEKAEVLVSGRITELTVCAVGGTIGTPKEGISGDVIEVRSFDDVKALGQKARGKIIFYNRPFDRTMVNTGEAYGGAVNQRTSGAVEAAKVGAAGVIVRSMTNAVDDEPHTGAMRYDDSIPKIPAAAVSTADANMLSALLGKQKSVTLTLRLSAKTYADVPSYNVIGQITGKDLPNEIILVGGHLDSWDKGTGAHDDGSGIAHSIETIRLIAASGLQPKRTIRAVLYANEENGLKGGRAYAARVKMSSEKHLAAIESDAGGFLPRGFGVSTDSVRFEKIRSYSSLLEIAGAEKIRRGGGGADISTLEQFGTVMIGLNPESQRYFDYHHSHHDTIEKVHPRELELGAIAMSILAWVLAQDGI